MFVGTEAAFSLRDRALNPFVLEGCVLSALWLIQASGEVLFRLTGHQAYRSGTHTFAHYPNKSYPAVGPGHTWTKCEPVIRKAREHCTPSRVLSPDPVWNHGGFFDLSEFPAPTTLDGAVPSDERQEFLQELVDAITEVRVLVFHGRGHAGNSKTMGKMRSVLTARFLGLADLSASVNEWVGILSNSGKTRRGLHWFHHEDRLVIWSNALNGNSRPNASYIAAIGILIAHLLNGDPPKLGVDLPRRCSAETGAANL